MLKDVVQTMLENNTSVVPHETTKNEVLVTAQTMFLDAMEAIYFRKSDPEFKFRASQMGKPAVLLAWEYFNGRPFIPTTQAQLRKLMSGLVFEIDVAQTLTRHGMDFLIQQEFSMQGISGHADFIVESPSGEKLILETKCVSEKRFKEYRKNGMGQQYNTQLELYKQFYQCSGMFVVSSTEGDLFCGYSPWVPDKESPLVKRAFAIKNLLEDCESFDEALERGIRPPKLLTRKDGTHYPCREMYAAKGLLHPVCYALYNVSFNEAGGYVVETQTVGSNLYTVKNNL